LSLYTLHRIVIGVAVLFCAGYAVRGLAIATASGGEGDAGASVSALASAVLAVGLALYLRWLIRAKPGLGRAGKRTEPRRP
jgi:hypothetical protein